ncbi:MAG: PIN domain-containing protein [Myxococcota bacterium]
MRLLVDTNVVLDPMLARHPHDAAARRVVSLMARGELEGYLGATTVTTIFYLASKHAGREAARAQLERLLAIFRVAPVTETVIREALAGDFEDFEDAVLHEAARCVGADAILTRDSAGFRRASCRVLTPDALLASLAESSGDR